jgi:ABC-type nitrate/sulfonate/bicarbonate transport system ATPase subunit/ABC-type nitrate/sulfonate/bicarbonate transport system permease component
MATVRLKNLSFSYPLRGSSLPVLENLDAEFEEGKISAIVGKSGCGKTSLLRLIAGLSSPTMGKVEIDDTPLEGIRDKTSIIFQDFGLLPWANVWGNAELGLKAKGVPSQERRRRVDLILAELGLSPFTRLFPARLSGGMRQRVAIARALASDSDLLLLDEPFSSLDAISREALQDSLLETQRRHGTTIILVTHSIEEAAYLADTVYFLDGSPASLSVRHDTGRRSEESHNAPIKSLNPKSAADALSDKSQSDRITGLAGSTGSYRNSQPYFSDIAALRGLFASLPPAQPEPPKPSRKMPQTLKGFFSRLAKIALAACILLAAWAGFAALLGKPFLPKPVLAIGVLLQCLQSGSIMLHVGASLRRILLALLLAAPPAWALGLMAGRIKVVETLLSPIMYLLHPLPKVAFLPILMLLLGLGDGSKIALMGLVIFGQLFMAARDSAKAIAPPLVDSVRSLGCRSWGIFRWVIAPATLPSLLSALRVSLGTAIAVLFLSETFASMDGLGWYIMDAWSRVNYPDMYAAILALALLGLALYLILDALESLALRWREIA